MGSRQSARDLGLLVGGVGRRLAGALRCGPHDAEQVRLGQRRTELTVAVGHRKLHVGPGVDLCFPLATVLSR